MATAFQLTDQPVQSVLQPDAKAGPKKVSPSKAKEKTMLHTKIETADAALAEAAPRMAGTLAEGLGEIASKGSQWRDKYPDDVVIAWLAERKVVGPFDARLLDEIRDGMARDEFIKSVQIIRQSPGKFAACVAKLRDAGLEKLADDLNALGTLNGDVAPEVPPSSGPDAELVTAWATRQAALGTIERRGNVQECESHSPVAAAAYDHAEVTISRTKAFTLAGVLAKLWVGLSHLRGPDSGDDGHAVASIRRADIAALGPLDEFDFDWEVLLGAVRDLTEIVERKPDTSGEFATAFAEFERIHAEELRLPASTFEEEKVLASACDRTSEAFDQMIEIPAPDLAGAIAKLNAIVAFYEVSCVPNLAKVVAELTSLHGSGAPEHA